MEFQYLKKNTIIYSNLVELNYALFNADGHL